MGSIRDKKREQRRERKREKNRERWKSHIEDRLENDDFSYEELNFLYNITKKNQFGRDHLNDIMEFFSLREKVTDIVNGK